MAGGSVRPELFDAGERACVPAQGELSGLQMFATATLLSSGDVLVPGGYDQRTRSSAAAWLVSPDNRAAPQRGR